MLSVAARYLALLLGAACTAPTAVAQGADELAAALAKLRVEHQIPVLAAALVHADGRTTTVRLGASPHTALRWGSITKTVTALTVLALAEQGKLELHAPLHRYIEQTYWRNPWRSSHPVRVIDLLELRAGFPDLSAREFAVDQPMTLQAALALDPQRRTCLWPPGTQHVYSNLTVGLTELLIETVTGRAFEQAALALTLQPLGMHGAGFRPLATLPGGFMADGITEIPYWHMTYAAYGALNASLTDMLKLLRYLHADAALTPLVRRHVFSPHGRRWAGSFRFDYAAGLYPRVRQGHVWHTHGGDADGYRSRLAVLPGARGGYVVNINVDNPGALRKIEQLIEAFLTRGLPTPQPPADYPLTAASSAHMVGSYLPSSTRFAIKRWQTGELSPLKLQFADGHLLAKRRGQTTTLYPVSPELFRRAGDPIATVVFLHIDGDVYLQGALGNYRRVGAAAP